MTETKMSKLGQVKIEGEHATLTFERHLPHPPEAIWKAITDPGELSKWYMDAKIDGRMGGRIEFSSGEGKVTGTVLVWDPPYVFEHEWIVDRSKYPKAEFGVIRWELLREEDGTILKLIHRGLPRQTVRNFAPGVHALLDRLETYLVEGSLPDWRKQLQELQSSYSR
jgi:uncharacterized protein YndB with AHSA1/START domain